MINLFNESTVFESYIFKTGELPPIINYIDRTHCETGYRTTCGEKWQALSPLGDVSALGDCGGQVNYVFYARSFTEV